MRASTKVFLLLVSLTFLAFFIGLTEISNGWFVSVLLFSTFVKGKLIVDYFMGMAEYKSRWSNFPTLWLGFVLLVVSGIYFFV
jgi:heme/copper-type cytochrome/quinol oxidase subunit 4